MSNDPLMQPFQLKHLTLRNRIMSTAHEPAYSEDGMPKARYRLYHAEKARGGIGLTMTAGSAIIGPDSPEAFGNLHAYRDEIVPYIRELTDAVHEHGAAVMIQITHLGRRTNWNKADWLPVLAPSPIREPAHRAFPKQAELWDLDRIVRNYADAAARMKEGGMDGIEIEAWGHLMDQFWSPATNQRDDDYGGSLDNRLRFTWRVLDAIRHAVGDDFLVGVRMVADEDWAIGLSREDGVEIARRLQNSGKVDFLNLIRGHIEHDAHLSRVIPLQGTKSAPHLDFCGEVRAETKAVVFHAGRISDVATARHAVATGKLDLVGMTRPHIAEPHIARLVREGRENDIRPCVGATYCLDRIYEGHEALCIHNAATGREATMPQIIEPGPDAAKTVVIVGAGPAGLEAARVASARGHHVTVFEAADKPGGQVTIAARLPRRRELNGIIDWRMDMCTRQGVTFHFNHWAEAQDVLELEPDIVIVATGGLPDTDCVAGAEHVVSSWDILTGDVKPGADVLLFDDNAQHPGLSAAEMIALGGARLEIVTPERFFAADIGGLNHAAYATVFDQHDVRITINKRLMRVSREGNRLKAIIGSDYTDKTEARLVDTVVVEHGTLPLADLYEELQPQSTNGGEVDYDDLIAVRAQTLHNNEAGKFQLFRIGDAVASRNTHAAVYDALRLLAPL